jgi:hypothetical protein
MRPVIALPPFKGPVLSVSLLYDLPDDDAAQRLLDNTAAATLVRFSVRTRPFLDLTDGQTAPDYAIPADRIRDLNRNIEGHIEVVASRHAEAAPEPGSTNERFACHAATGAPAACCSTWTAPNPIMRP